MSILTYVGRFGDSKNLTVETGTTIGQALKLGGYRVGDNEVIQDLETNPYKESDLVEAGRSYFLVQKAKNG